jgi:N-acetylmuramoyl-L-alanine amidase
LLSVALSLGSPPPDIIRHRVSVEPGLSSATRWSSGRLARAGIGSPAAIVNPPRTSNLTTVHEMSEFFPDSALVKQVRPSPNHGSRRIAMPDAIILHYTGMASAEAALARLCDPEAEVSCHYLVFENGDIVQLVPETRRAWHAGKSLWAGEDDMNSASIGIELANGGHDFGAPPFPAEQIDAVIALCRDINTRRKIAPHRILGHSDIAPFRKIDPGEIFPWARLAQAGIGHYIEPMAVEGGTVLERGDRGPEVETLQKTLAAYGYGIAVTGSFDLKTEGVVAAFQRHFRPERVDGRADLSTRATLKALLASVKR